MKEDEIEEEQEGRGTRERERLDNARLERREKERRKSNY